MVVCEGWFDCGEAVVELGANEEFDVDGEAGSIFLAGWEFVFSSFV